MNIDFIKAEITKTLKGSNSTPLKINLVVISLKYLHNNGLRKQM